MSAMGRKQTSVLPSSPTAQRSKEYETEQADWPQQEGEDEAQQEDAVRQANPVGLFHLPCAYPQIEREVVDPAEKPQSRISEENPDAIEGVVGCEH